MNVSVIVTTYDWPQALLLSLRALARQTRLPDEVIVADDGSGPDTADMLARLARDYPVRLAHVWQEHRGFRAARSRNRAIAAARGDYVLLLDGDMVPQRRFVADHLGAAQQSCFTQGARSLASPALTETLLRDGRLDVTPFTRGLDQRLNALRLPGVLAAAFRKPRGYGKKRVMSCNQGFWREDLVAANGFDERMHGWGREDTELAVRCFHRGVHRLQLRGAALAVHLHHPPRSHSGTNPNDAYLAQTERLRLTRCEQGLDQHAAEFAVPPADLRGAAAPELPHAAALCA